MSDVTAGFLSFLWARKQGFAGEEISDNMACVKTETWIKTISISIILSTLLGVSSPAFGQTESDSLAAPAELPPPPVASAPT